MDEPSEANLHQISVLPYSLQELAAETKTDPGMAPILEWLSPEVSKNEELKHSEILTKYTVENWEAKTINTLPGVHMRKSLTVGCGGGECLY